MKTKFYILILATVTSSLLMSCNSSRLFTDIEYPAYVNLQSGNYGGVSTEKRETVYRSYSVLYDTLNRSIVTEAKDKPVDNSQAAAPYMLCVGQK